jgi:hypothetical protein
MTFTKWKETTQVKSVCINSHSAAAGSWATCLAVIAADRHAEYLKRAGRRSSPTGMDAPRGRSTLEFALLAIAVALVLVGVVSGTIIRHVVQLAPVLVAGVVALRRPAWSRFAAIPVFAFWLFIMVLIWLHLLGLAHVITGQFKPAEVVLTVVIGLACVVGLGVASRRSTGASWHSAVLAFVLFSALQVTAMWVSLQPLFATR